MMKNFLAKYQRPLLILSFVLALVLLSLLFTSSFTQKGDDENSEPTNGVDGPGEVRGLPISNALYSADFNKNKDGSDDTSTINVTAPAGYRSIVVKRLFKTSLNPSDYKINFNVENPFSRYEK